jgi:hypothetical protein
MTYAGGAADLFSGGYNYAGEAGLSVVTTDGTQQIVLLGNSWKPAEVDVTVSVITPTDASPGAAIGKGEAHRVTLDDPYSVPEGLFLCELKNNMYCTSYYNSSFRGQYILVALEDGLKLEKVKTGFDDGSKTYNGRVGSDGTTTVDFNALEDQPVYITLTPDDDVDLRLSVLGQSDYSDSGLSGEPERLTFYPTSTGPQTIEVFAFGNDGGSFTLTLADD